MQQLANNDDNDDDDDDDDHIISTEWLLSTFSSIKIEFGTVVLYGKRKA